MLKNIAHHSSAALCDAFSPGFLYVEEKNRREIQELTADNTEIRERTQTAIVKNLQRQFISWFLLGALVTFVSTH